MAVNLLPWRQRQRRRQWTIAGCFTACTLVLLLLLLVGQRWHLDRRYLRLKTEQQQRQTALAEGDISLRRQRESLQQLQETRARRQRLEQQSVRLMRWHQFWQALPALLPDSVWLKRVEKSATRLSLEGEALTMREIDDFRQRLGEQALFSRVTQGNVQRQPGHAYHFHLYAQPDEAGDE